MTVAIKIKEEILKEYDKGFSVSMLAATYNFSRNSIYRWLKERKNKKEPYQRKIPEAFKIRHKLSYREKRKIVKLKKENKHISYKEIIANLSSKVTAGAIYYYLKKAKLTNKKHFEYPSLENFEEYEKQEEEVLLKEYRKFAKDKEHPNYHEIIYSFFRIFRDKGLFSKAIEVGKKILKRKVRYLEKLKSKMSFIEGEIYYHLGDCFRFNNQKAAAAKAYHKAYEKFEEKSNNDFTLEFIKGACRALELKGEHNKLTINELKNQLTTTSNS